MYHPILHPRAQRQLKNIKEADIVIGLPTYKNTQTAVHVARIALSGASQYFPHLRTVLVNADAGSKATTRRAVADLSISNNGYKNTVVTGRYKGVLGHGSAVAALVDAGLALDAKVIIILDSNTASITPEWIAGLAYLILENKADLVMPRYHWLQPDGVLSDLVVYPLFRALWGQSVRHPAAPDFALSPLLATALLDEDVWETEVAGFGLPPWLTTYAVLDEWRVAQSAIGEKKYTSEVAMPGSEPGELGRQALLNKQFLARFRNIVSVLLYQVYRHEACWTDVKDFRSLATLTRFVSDSELAPLPEGELSFLLDELALGWIEYRPLWQRTLTPDNLAQVEALAALPEDRFYFPSDFWARIVYDFAIAFNKSEDDPLQIVNSLFPLFCGRLAAFRQEIAGLSLVGREGTIAAQAVEFEEMRAYLKSRWYVASSKNDRNDIL